MEIVDGFVGQVSVSVPWKDLVQESTMVEVRNLELTIQPKQRSHTAGKLHVPIEKLMQCVCVCMCIMYLYIQ